VSKISTFENWAKNVVIKNAIMLNIMHNIFDLRDTESFICIILVLLKKTDGISHYLSIR